MIGARTPLRPTSNGGTSTIGAAVRRHRAAAIGGAAALALSLGCQTAWKSAPRTATDAAIAEVRGTVETGLNLYESGEFVLAAQRFANAADGAEAIGAREILRRAVAAECTSWLRARKLEELSACTARLEDLQRRHPRADPGVNTLIALGAITGQRPLPPLRIPDSVKPLIRATVRESRR